MCLIALYLVAGAATESGWEKKLTSFFQSRIADAIMARVVFVFMVGTKEMGAAVLQRKLRLVVAWLRRMCVGCGLCCQKLGILLLFNGYVIFSFFFLGEEETWGPFKFSLSTDT